MNKTRESEIKDNLGKIYNDFVLPENQEEMTMFDLISNYNKQFENPELIGGQWVRENCDDVLGKLP